MKNPLSRSRSRASPGLEPVASVVQRLAVLMTAGVPPSSAWNYLAPESSPVVSAVARRAAAGSPVAVALVEQLDTVEPAERQAWRGLAAAWRVATETGAGLAPSLREFAVSLRSLANAQREIRVALSAPVATARLVMVLPAVGLLFGVVLGFDTLGILLTTGPGLACLAIGAALMLTAAAWNRRLVASAQPRDLTPGLRYELMAIAVSGGGSIDRASAAVDLALRSTGLDGVGDNDGVEAVLALSRRAGVPAGELLRSEGEEARRKARADAAARASVLAVRLMLPLGLCVLPAFMVLGVAPLLIAVITSTVSGF